MAEFVSVGRSRGDAVAFEVLEVCVRLAGAVQDVDVAEFAEASMATPTSASPSSSRSRASDVATPLSISAVGPPDSAPGT